MKKIMLAVTGLVLANVANAVVIPGWERPIMGAELTYIVPTKPVRGLKATHLTLHQQDGAKEPTMFTLTEDTGIRCVTTPCPSTKETEFTITGVHVIDHGHSDVVTYEAVEKLKNIPPHVRIAPRHLVVQESEMELVKPGGGGFMHRIIWNVEVKKFAQQSDHYYGTAEHLASIATVGQ